MFELKSCISIILCGFIFKELSSICANGQYPYPGLFYPPAPFSSLPAYPPPPYPFLMPPAYYGSTFYPSPTSPPQRTSNSVNSKPKIVKPFRVQSGSAPVIMGRGDGESNTPIIISTRTSRTPYQEPTLLSPFTNLIHMFLKSLAPRTCDCDGEYQR